MDKPGLAVLIGRMKAGKPSASDEEEKPVDGEEESPDEDKAEEAALSDFKDALDSGDFKAASEHLEDFISLCYPELEKETGEEE